MYISDVVMDMLSGVATQEGELHLKYHEASRWLRLPLLHHIQELPGDHRAEQARHDHKPGEAML